MNDVDYNNRENIINTSLNIKMQNIKEEEWNVKKEYIELVKKIVKQIDPKLCDLCNKIKSRRNDINHFGFQDSPADYATMKRELNNYYYIFKNYIEENSCECKE